MDTHVFAQQTTMEQIAKTITTIAQVLHAKIVEPAQRHRMDTHVLAQQISMEQAVRIITIHVQVHHVKMEEHVQIF